MEVVEIVNSLEVLQAFVIGAVQGVTEWLPVSSQGIVILAQNIFFDNSISTKQLLELAIFLHLGTTLAAIIYFRHSIVGLLKELKHLHGNHPDTHHGVKGFVTGLLRFDGGDKSMQRLGFFIVVATIVSGVIGLVLLELLQQVIVTDNAGESDSTGAFFMLLIGGALLVTAFLQYKKNSGGMRDIKNLNFRDALFVGFIQGFAIIPGLSRSGTTTAALLIRNIKNSHALQISFLMSIPVVLGANIILNYDIIQKYNLSIYNTLLALGASFVFGIITIHWFMKFARKVNMAKFIFIIAVITIIGAVYSLMQYYELI